MKAEDSTTEVRSAKEWGKEMLIEAFEQVKGDRFDPLHSATNGITAKDEELLIAAARAGNDTPSNTAHVAAAGSGNLGGGSQSKNNERRARENFDATLRQMTLDQLNKAWIDNERAIAGLTREIDALDSEIAFLNQFQDEEDLLDENGQLRDDVKDYLRRKGRDPNQMDASEAFLFMQGEEVNAHERRADAQIELETREERQGRLDGELTSRGVDVEAMRNANEQEARSELRGVTTESVFEVAERTGNDAVAEVAAEIAIDEGEAQLTSGFSMNGGLG